MRSMVAALAVLSLAGTAMAEEQTPFMQVVGGDDDGDGEWFPWEPEWEGGYAMAIGATRIGNETFLSFALDLRAAVWLGRASLIGSYALGSVSRGDPEVEIRGSAHRFGVGGAYKIIEPKRFVGPELSVGALVGRQFIGWDQGTLSRRDISIFVEGGMVVSLGHSRGGDLEFRAPSSLLANLRIELIFSRTPPFAIVPVAATSAQKSETDFGFLIGYGLRLRN